MNVFKTIRVNYVVNYCQFFNKNTLRYACYKNIKKSGCIFILTHKNAARCIGELK